MNITLFDTKPITKSSRGDNKKNMIFIINSFRDGDNLMMAKELLFIAIQNGMGQNLIKKFNFHVEGSKEDSEWKKDTLSEIYVSAVENLINGKVDYSLKNGQIVNGLFGSRGFIYSDMRKKSQERLFGFTKGKYNTVYTGADGRTIGIDVIRSGSFDKKDHYNYIKKDMLRELFTNADYQIHLQYIKSLFDDKENLIIDHIVENDMSIMDRIISLGITKKEYEAFRNKAKKIIGKELL